MGEGEQEEKVNKDKTKERVGVEGGDVVEGGGRVE